LALAFGGVAAMVVAGSAMGSGVDHPSGGGGAACTVPGARYATIQSAVDVATCATIKVAPGTYAENVTIARGLTLNGAKSGKDARSRRSGGESIINGGTLATITVSANNVTIDGFTLNGPPSSGTAALVMQTGNTGETIQNNVINNPGRAASITTSRTTCVHSGVGMTCGFELGVPSVWGHAGWGA
jgi:hypothetical protein